MARLHLRHQHLVHRLQRTALWALQLPIAYLFIARLLQPLRRSERLPLRPGELRTRLGAMTALRLGVRAVAAAAIVVLVGILAIDRTGGRERPPPSPSTASTPTASESRGG